MFPETLIWNSKLTNLIFQVTWVRRKDRYELLTVGRSTHSMDTRFVVANSPGWNLLIKNVRHEDAGLYECQVRDVYKKMCYFWYRGNKNGCNVIYALRLCIILKKWYVCVWGGEGRARACVWCTYIKYISLYKLNSIKF